LHQNGLIHSDKSIFLPIWAFKWILLPTYYSGKNSASSLPLLS